MIFGWEFNLKKLTKIRIHFTKYNSPTLSGCMACRAQIPPTPLFMSLSILPSLLLLLSPRLSTASPQCGSQCVICCKENIRKAKKRRLGALSYSPWAPNGAPADPPICWEVGETVVFFGKHSPAEARTPLAGNLSPSEFGVLRHLVKPGKDRWAVSWGFGGLPGIPQASCST